MSDHGWQDRGACHGMGHLLFYGPEGEHQAEREVREEKAKAVCARCEVRPECLEYALERDDKCGIWAGEGADDRKNLRRRRMRQGAA